LVIDRTGQIGPTSHRRAGLTIGEKAVVIGRTTHWSFGLAIAIAGLLLANAAEARAATFQATPCPFANSHGGVCGYLITPLWHANPHGPTIKVAVAIYPPAGGILHADPVFFLGGGPGFPTLGSADGMAALKIGLTGRTVVELDQRGLAHSIPSLECPDLTALQFTQPDIALAGSAEEAVLNYAPGPPLDRALEAVEKCRATLTSEGVDVTAFNSEESADDIEDLRKALGYDRIDLFGTSYGTRLALMVLRRHPGHIRAVILDGVFPPQKGAKNTGEETAEAYKALFNYCAGLPACAAAHPRLEQQVINIAETLDAAPVTITVVPQCERGPPSVQARVTGDTFLAVLAYALAYEDGTTLPDVVERVAAGDFRQFSQLYGRQFDTTSTYGMHYSVECGEDEDFSPPPVLHAIASGLPAYLRGPYLRGQSGDWRMCEAWNVPLIKESREPVHSDTPTLLLSGQFDWATPPSWAALAASTLSHATTEVIPLAGHQTYFRSACSRRIADAWLDDPKATLPHCNDAPSPGR
jgi:pimeloyl-ACP methyl ester carboxylesterase